MRRLLAAIVCITTVQAAALDLGSPSTEVASTGRCPRGARRCLAATENAVVWTEPVTNSKMRLKASIGAVRLSIADEEWIDHPAVATDGVSFTIAWQHPSQRFQAISAVDVRGGAFGAPLMLGLDRQMGDPPADVVRIGGEVAVVLPSSLVFLRDDRPVYVDLPAERPATPFGVVAAVNGDSVLLVRQLQNPAPHPGFSIPPVIQLGTVFTSATVVGPGVAATAYRVAAIDRGQHALAAAGGGDGYLLVWKDGRGISAVRLGYEGQTVGTDHLIAAAAPGGASAVAATRDGWLVVWDDLEAETEVVRAAELDANGKVVGDIVTVSAGKSPSIVKRGADRFRVFYRTLSSIESREIATGAETIGPQRRRSVR